MVVWSKSEINLTCPSLESNPRRWITRKYFTTSLSNTLPRRCKSNAVEVHYMPSLVTFSPTKLDFFPEVPGYRESYLVRFVELLPGLGWVIYGRRHCRRAKIFQPVPARNRTKDTGSTGNHSFTSL